MSVHFVHFSPLSNAEQTRVEMWVHGRLHPYSLWARFRARHHTASLLRFLNSLKLTKSPLSTSLCINNSAGELQPPPPRSSSINSAEKLQPPPLHDDGDMLPFRSLLRILLNDKIRLTGDRNDGDVDGELRPPDSFPKPLPFRVGTTTVTGDSSSSLF